MTVQNIERRTFPAEIRAVNPDDPDSRLIGGHAAVFNQLSVNLGGFREKIAKGAFRESLGKDDPVALWQHEAMYPLGRLSTGTLTAKEDREGLAFEVDVAKTNMGNDALVSIGRGDVNQVSFQFRTLDDSWETVVGEEIRTLKRVELMDVSPVTFAAYPQTDVALRSLEAEVERRALEAAPAAPAPTAPDRDLMERRLRVEEEDAALDSPAGADVLA